MKRNIMPYINDIGIQYTHLLDLLPAGIYNIMCCTCTCMSCVSYYRGNTIEVAKLEYASRRRISIFPGYNDVCCVVCICKVYIMMCQMFACLVCIFYFC